MCRTVGKEARGLAARLMSATDWVLVWVGLHRSVLIDRKETVLDIEYRGWDVALWLLLSALHLRAFR